MLGDKGVKETWSYNCLAFVLLGSSSRRPESGRTYQSAFELVGPNNLVTVDLRSLMGGLQSDYARSFCIENSKHTSSPIGSDFIDGLQ